MCSDSETHQLQTVFDVADDASIHAPDDEMHSGRLLRGLDPTVHEPLRDGRRYLGQFARVAQEGHLFMSDVNYNGALTYKGKLKLKINEKTRANGSAIICLSAQRVLCFNGSVTVSKSGS